MRGNLCVLSCWFVAFRQKNTRESTGDFRMDSDWGSRSCTAVPGGSDAAPEIDLAYTLSQNKAMVEEGLHTFTNKGYFSVYTNNIPLTIVIYWVFRLAKALGCHNYELAGGVFNAGMNVVTYAMGYCIARKITSERTAFLLLTVLLTNPALYAYAAYYYTDTISLAITSLAIYWFVCALQTKPGHTGKKIMLFCISGMAIYWAARIRVTSIFILIAAAVYALLRGGAMETGTENCSSGNSRDDCCWRDIFYTLSVSCAFRYDGQFHYLAAFCGDGSECGYHRKIQS